MEAPPGARGRPSGPPAVGEVISQAGTASAGQSRAALMGVIRAGRRAPPTAGGVPCVPAAATSEPPPRPVLQRRAAADYPALDAALARIASPGFKRKFEVQNLKYQSEEGPQGAPAGRLPAVIVIHSTNASKEQQLHNLEAFAARGFLACAIDTRHHGARAVGPDAYEHALVRAFEGHAKGGGGGAWDRHPFLYDTVWDVVCLVSYLGARADVDPARMGITGRSLGGMISWLAAAVDDRIAASAPLIGVQNFGWAVEHGQFQGRVDSFRTDASQALPPLFAAAAREAGVGEVTAGVMRTVWDRLCPFLLGALDAPSSLPLVAPRPMLVVNGREDPRCPVGGLDEAFAPAKEAYRALGCPERFSALLEWGVGHEATPTMEAAAVDWLSRWLLGGEDAKSPAPPSQPRRVSLRSLLHASSWLPLDRRRQRHREVPKVAAAALLFVTLRALVRARSPNFS
mmetsp:Transcript_53183/g.168877  ORF Transcript_53183/g.168877 Transcript_53183/m.168877 type:complete len:457 (+) Transcript_53183:253-1623(+)